MVIDPVAAHLWIHWPQGPAPEDVTYDMKRWRHYLLCEADDVVRLYHDMDNILDWGMIDPETATMQVFKAVKP